MHHSIEEEHIFPFLATRMPAFRPDAPALLQHRQIHVGMDGLQAYLRKCQRGERELKRDEVKVKMETWGSVLWQHLDDEVRELGAEQMRKYWSLRDMRVMPM